MYYAHVYCWPRDGKQRRKRSAKSRTCIARCRKPLCITYIDTGPRIPDGSSKQQAGIRGAGGGAASSSDEGRVSVCSAFGVCITPGSFRTSGTQSMRNEGVLVHRAGAARADGACKKFPFASQLRNTNWRSRGPLPLRATIPIDPCPQMQRVQPGGLGHAPCALSGLRRRFGSGSHGGGLAWYIRARAQGWSLDAILSHPSAQVDVDRFPTNSMEAGASGNLPPPKGAPANAVENFFWISVWDPCGRLWLDKPECSGGTGSRWGR